MIEVVGNLWTYKLPDGRDPDVRVITTNGAIRKDGTCVMGRGCAWEASQRYPGIDKALGDLIKMHGNHVHLLRNGMNEPSLYSFPVKHHWREVADRELIKRSAFELVALTEMWDTVVMPRPGCGNGKLRWCSCINGEGESCDGIKHVLEAILDDRYHVISFK
jgi:hypothetical protein